MTIQDVSFADDALPDQSDEQLLEQVNQTLVLAGNPQSDLRRMLLDRRRPNKSAPFNATTFLKNYESSLPSFFKLRDSSIELSTN